MPAKKTSPAPAPVASPAEHGHQFATAGAAINYRDSWRIFKIMSEMVEGYQFLSEFKKEVTVLGSARLQTNNKYYKIAEELGRFLGKNGFTTITGGGPGIMEAANKGAFEAKGESVGLNIQLPFEQRTNPYVRHAVAFYYFFTRKVMLTSPASAFVYFPGGFGTFDEFFEVIDYMEVGQMDRSPIALVGREFWEPLFKFLRQKSVGEAHAFTEADLRQCKIVDTAEEAFDFIKDAPTSNVCNTDPTNPLCIEGTDWKIFRIMAELVEGFEFLTKVTNDITILGTRNFLPGTPQYNAAYELGKLLAKNKYAVVTGGGPGIMEAANKGAFEAGGESIGINMRLEGKERVNSYLTKSIGFVYPFVRKLILTSPSKAFVFFPGGFGTLHQLFELLTLIETKKVAPMPLILYGRSFWQPLLTEVIHKMYADFKTISQLDESYLMLADSPEEVMGYLK